MFAELSFRDSLTVCFMRYGAISYIFWLCYMMLAIRDVGQKKLTNKDVYGVHRAPLRSENLDS